MVIMVSNSVMKKIKSAVREIWKVEIPNDYDANFLFKEDTLKNALYYHLRTKLDNDFLERNNLGIYTEYYIDGYKIDLVIAEIDNEKASETHLRECVTDLAIAMELKYKAAAVDELYYEDVKKVVKYLTDLPYPNCHYYLGFIQEVLYDKASDFSWLNKRQRTKATGRVTELIQFLDAGTGKAVWNVIEH